jgi:NTE family protein
MDGGLADNNGLRAVTDEYTRGFIRRRLNDGAIKQFVVIVVNARTSPADPIDRHEAPPRVPDVIMKTMTVSMENYSFETVEFMRGLAAERLATQQGLAACQRILDQRCPGGEPLPALARDVNVHVVEVNSAGLADAAERDFFLNLPTSFVLTAGEVACLIAAGRKLLRAAPAYQELLRSLGGHLVPSAAAAGDFPPESCRRP